MDQKLKKSLIRVAQFYDQRKVGDVGSLGFWRSTDLMKLLGCTERLLDERILNPDQTLFLDLGCADGRVNVLLSYLVKVSVGIELDEGMLEDYAPFKSGLARVLKDSGLLPPPKNIFVFQGDALDERIHRSIVRQTGIRFEEFDLFYTYLVMHQEFAQLIGQRGKKGSLFMVYGLQNILPTYPGFRLLEDMSPLEGILGLYRKEE